MELGLILSLAGIAIVIGGAIYFFVLPDEEEPIQPQEPVNPPDNGHGPTDPPEETPDVPVDHPVEEPERPVDPDPGNPIPVDRPVSELAVSNRAIDVLHENGIETVQELRNLDEDFEELNGIGPAYAEDIREQLREE